MILYGIIGIYLIGYILAYYIYRRIILNTPKDWDWAEVFIGMLISTFSWAVVLIGGVILLGNYLQKKMPGGPPKWL